MRTRHQQIVVLPVVGTLPVGEVAGPAGFDLGPGEPFPGAGAAFHPPIIGEHGSHPDSLGDGSRRLGRPQQRRGPVSYTHLDVYKRQAVGQQSRFPVLFKRGMGITLEESLNAVEYIAASGNQRIAFCLRGVKTHLGDPHRNFVDFAHVPVVKRLTRMPVCVDPSHSVGQKMRGTDGLLDIHHVTAQGIIAGANMVLVDVHPRPEAAPVSYTHLDVYKRQGRASRW